MVPLPCPSGQTITVDAECPGPKYETITGPNGTMTCDCCDLACLSTSNVAAHMCTPGGLGGGGGPGLTGGSASAAPKPAGSVNLLGPQMGVPFFSSVPLADNEGIRRDVSARWSQFRTASGARSGVRSGGRGGARDFFHQRFHHTPGCFGISQGAKLSFFSSVNPTVSAPSTPASFWPPDAVPSPIDTSNAQPITGAGAGIGPRDIPPVPNPQPVNNIHECNKGWWFNPSSRTCFFTQSSCQYGGGQCVPSPNGDPSLNGAVSPGHVQSWNNCGSGTFYNECTRACYPAAACQAASSQPGCQCIQGTQ